MNEKHTKVSAISDNSGIRLLRPNTVKCRFHIITVRQPKIMQRSFNIYGNEVEAVCQTFFLWKGIHDIARNNEDIFNGLNESPLSWNTITFALQNYYFILLGRLFDTDGDSFSAHTFLRNCIENIEQFSKENLRKRKTEIASGDLSWLDEYIENAYEPTEDDFQKLRGAITKHKKIYEKIYRPIRNKVIAHKDQETISVQEELYKKTDIGEIEDILNILFQVKEVVYQLLHNGRLCNIGDFKFNEEDYVVTDAEKMLNFIKVKSPL